MAFTRPTLAELVARVQADAVSRLELATPILRRALVYVVSRAVAGAAHMLHGHLDYLAKQLFPDTSEDAFLLRQAALFGLRLTPASYAAGHVTISGAPETTVPAGVVVLRAGGAAYVSTGDVTIPASTGPLNTALMAVAAVDAGADGNCDEATSVTFEAPLSGVEVLATVASGGISGGADQEDLESLRTRLRARLQTPPHGGSRADYIAWAKEIAGVTRAWCYPLELGAGTVVVRFVRDDDVSPIPDSGEVAAVQAHIDEVRPVTATVTVLAPTAVPVNFTIDLSPDTTATREAVRAELEDLLRRVAEPGVTLLRSQIEVAIGTAAGVANFTLTAPAADVTHTAGQLATMGTITWT